MVLGAAETRLLNHNVGRPAPMCRLTESHAIAQARDQKNARAENAFGISKDYKAGGVSPQCRVVLPS